MSAAKSTVDWAELIARICFTIFGSYAALWMLAFALASVLPTRRAEAVITASLLACLVYPFILLWALTVPRLRSWRGVALLLIVSCAIMAGVAVLERGLG